MPISYYRDLANPSIQVNSLIGIFPISADLKRSLELQKMNCPYRHLLAIGEIALAGPRFWIISTSCHIQYIGKSGDLLFREI